MKINQILLKQWAIYLRNKSMQKIAYIKIFSLIILSFFLYWCWPKPEHNIQNILLENKVLKKYNEISKSWNIQEEAQININWETQTTMMELNIIYNASKNLLSVYQNGKYNFQMITKNKNFDETQIISWIISVISKNNEYFIKPENIIFIWPKWKNSNKEIENKISEINNKRIKIDKQTPFIYTSETIFVTQILLNQLYQDNTKDIQIKQDDKENIVFTWKYLNIPIDWILYTNTWIFYGTNWQELQIYKKSGKIWFTLIWKENNIISDIKLKKGRKKITLKFEGKLIYDKIQTFTQEIKLDINWKYIIRNTWYVQADLPSDYLYFTQTSLVKK